MEMSLAHSFPRLSAAISGKDGFANSAPSLWRRPVRLRGLNCAEVSQSGRKMMRSVVMASLQ